jgi:signal recognition particle subunit SRP54
MGSLSNIASMIPGMGSKVPTEMLGLGEEKMKKFEPILQSMTFEELLNPKIISGTRIQRIAFGAGVSESEVKALIDSFRQISRLSSKINPRKLKMLEKNFNMSKFKDLF